MIGHGILTAAGVPKFGSSTPQNPGRPTPLSSPRSRRPTVSPASPEILPGYGHDSPGIAEVRGHRPEIGSDEGSVLLRSQSQDLGIWHSFESSVVCRQKVHRWFASKTS